MTIKCPHPTPVGISRSRRNRTRVSDFIAHSAREAPLAKTGICSSSIKPWEPTQLESRPAVLIGRAGTRQEKPACQLRNATVIVTVQGRQSSALRDEVQTRQCHRKGLTRYTDYIGSLRKASSSPRGRWTGWCQVYIGTISCPNTFRVASSSTVQFPGWCLNSLLLGCDREEFSKMHNNPINNDLSTRNDGHGTERGTFSVIPDVNIFITSPFWSHPVCCADCQAAMWLALFLVTHGSQPPGQIPLARQSVNI